MCIKHERDTPMSLRGLLLRSCAIDLGCLGFLSSLSLHGASPGFASIDLTELLFMCRHDLYTSRQPRQNPPLVQTATEAGVTE